jgi:hypothetical protein
LQPSCFTLSSDGIVKYGPPHLAWFRTFSSILSLDYYLYLWHFTKMFMLSNRFIFSFMIIFISFKKSFMSTYVIKLVPYLLSKMFIAFI